jgi:hypothetical protein
MAELIGEDCVVTIKLGTVSGGVITWDGGGSFIISAKAKRFKISDEAETTNTKGLGDGRKKFRAHSGSTRIDLDKMVSFAGYDFLNGRNSRLGDVAQIAFKEYSGLSTPVTVNPGLIVKWETGFDEGEPTLETLSIMCDIDAA